MASALRANKFSAGRDYKFGGVFEQRWVHDEVPGILFTSWSLFFFDLILLTILIFLLFSLLNPDSSLLFQV